MESIRRHLKRLDANVSRSTFGRCFRLGGSGHPKERRDSTFLTEIRAGMTTFFTMAYIIAVNSQIVSQTGGTCVEICPDIGEGDCKVKYDMCVQVFQRDLVTATAAIAGVSSFMFGFLTNLPVALAPGMGLNAYFSYQVVGANGNGPVPYRLALTAVFVEGFIFVFLSLFGLRQWLVKIIPQSIKVASGVGIGLFLTLVGLSSQAGIGAISGGVNTPLQLAGCPTEFLNPQNQCLSHTLQNPSMWIGILCGGVLTAYLMAYRFKTAIVIGIAIVSILSWPRNTSFTYFPHDHGGLGDDRFSFFKQVVGFHPIETTLAVQTWNLSASGISASQFILALMTFLYVDIIDCTATVYSMARFSGAVDPTTGDFPRSTLAYCTDALSISIGSLFGLPPVTAFVESGAGIAEGGRSGLTAMTTGLCFLVSIFFAPIFASIPPWATGCTLILVGCMMMRQVTTVNWRYIGDAVPAFVTMAFMPFSYSVAYGLIAGLMTYTTLNGLIYLTSLLSGGRMVPPDADLQEYWTYKPHAGRLPWFIRMPKDGVEFWKHGNGSEKGEGKEMNLQGSGKRGSKGGQSSESERESNGRGSPSVAGDETSMMRLHEPAEAEVKSQVSGKSGAKSTQSGIGMLGKGGKIAVSERWA